MAFRAEHPTLTSRTSPSISRFTRPTTPYTEPTTTSNGSFVKMSATLEANSQKKTFGKSTREVPHHSQKASKWYPAEDEAQHKKVRLEYFSLKIGSDWWLSGCSRLSIGNAQLLEVMVYKSTISGYSHYTRRRIT